MWPCVRASGLDSERKQGRTRHCLTSYRTHHAIRPPVRLRGTTRFAVPGLATSLLTSTIHIAPLLLYCHCHALNRYRVSGCRDCSRVILETRSSKPLPLHPAFSFAPPSSATWLGSRRRASAPARRCSLATLASRQRRKRLPASSAIACHFATLAGRDGYCTSPALKAGEGSRTKRRTPSWSSGYAKS